MHTGTGTGTQAGTVRYLVQAGTGRYLVQAGAGSDHLRLAHARAWGDYHGTSFRTGHAFVTGKVKGGFLELYFLMLHFGWLLLCAPYCRLFD